MTIVQTLVLSIVEGLSEFLPISSTGHLILASNLLKISSTEFSKSFEIIIQLGAILSVVFLYWRKFLIDKKTLKNVLIAFVPTGLIGILVYKLVKQYLLDNVSLTTLNLIWGGIFLIIFERIYHKPKKVETRQLTPLQAVFIGLVQAISILPGISRAAATIVGGLLVGLDWVEAVEFSFLLAVPTMAAATGLDLVKSGHAFTPNQWLILAVGFLGSFVVALLTIKYFLKYVQRHDFTSFGLYRIVAGIAFWFVH